MRGAVGVIWASRLRRGWRSWAVLAVLLGLGTGTGLACLAGARRTASSFDRIAEATDYPDIVTSHGLEPDAAAPIIDSFEGVASHSTQVGFVGFVDGIDPALIKYYIGFWDGNFRHRRPTLSSGRFPDPDRPDEVLVAGKGVDAAGIEPGDELTMRLFLSDFSDMVAETFTVTGTGLIDVASDASQDRSSVWFTPAFTRTNAARLQAWSATSFVATPGTDIEDDLRPQIVDVGWSVDESRTVVQTRVHDAIRPLIAALALLGSLALVTTLAVVGQALARRAEASYDEGLTARVIGFTRGQVRVLDLLTVLSVAVPGVIVAVATAVLLSPLFPAGDVRRLEPDRGFAGDLTVLAAGAVGVVCVLALVDRLRSRRSVNVDRAAARPLLGGLTTLRPSVSTGLALAVGGTVRQRRRFATTVVSSTIALALLVAGIAFVSALERLTDDPVRYGAGWDLTTRNAYGEVGVDELRAMIADDPDIEGVSGAGVSQMLLNGLVVPAMPILPITTELWPTVVEGSIPRTDDEVLVGADVLGELDAEIGDTVRLEPSFTGTFSGSGTGAEEREATDVRIAGTAVFPSVELAGLDPTRLGVGVAMTWGLYQSVADSEGDRLPDIVFFDLADGVDPQAIIDRYPDGMPELGGFAPTEWLPSLAPAEVLETGRAAPLIWTFMILLGLTVLATLSHALASGVRQRRADYAVLKTLGFTRGQVLSSVAWQSTTTVVLALVIALPVGTALGRGSWRAFAHLVGVIDTPVIPVFSIALVALCALFATGFLSAGPGVLAAATPPARLLRKE